MIEHVLILAAGRGTRIAPVSHGLPKPLLPVAGKPIVVWTLEWLAASGITAAWMNLHYQADAVRRALGDGSRYGVSLRYAYEPEILGTAGAWRSLLPEWSGTSLVIYGDNLMRFDLAAFLGAHRGGGAPATVALFEPGRHPNTGLLGSRVALGSGGAIRGFEEGAHQDAGLVNAGAYLLEPSSGGYIGDGFQDFARDVFPQMVRGAQVRGYVLDDAGFCLGLDTPESFGRAEALLQADAVRLT